MDSCRQFLRTTTLVSLFVAGVSVSDLPAAEPFKLKAGLTGAAYDAEAKTLLTDGYQPVSVSGYEVQGDSHYAVVWEKRPLIPWAERHNLSAEDFQDNFDVLLGQGFRPVSLSVYNVGEGVRYAGIWERRAGQVRYMGVGMAAADFQNTAAAYIKEGYRPLTISGFKIGGQPRFSAIWEKAEGPAFETQLDLTADGLKETEKRMGEKGYAPTSVSGYDRDGTAHFTAVWEKRRGRAFEVRPDITPDELQKLPQTMTDQGFRIVGLAAYTVAGKPRFAAVWEKSS